MVVGASDPATRAIRFPWPWRVGIDHWESFAGFREGSEIIDRTAMFDSFAVTFLRSLNFGLFDKALRHPVVGISARTRHISLEPVSVDAGKFLPSTRFRFGDAEIGEF
jgi:hypothetical protein